LYNFLWSSKALEVVDSSPAFFCSPALRTTLHDYVGYNIGIAFGLSYNAWLASFSTAAWRNLEEHEIETQGHDRQTTTRQKGPVTLQTLGRRNNVGGVHVDFLEYKKFVLQWLANHGLSGLKRLMYATHTKLRT
jgi:centromere protein I